jgi:hypothetical protein
MACTATPVLHYQELESTLAAAVRILVHRLQPRYNNRIQCLGPVEQPVEVFIMAAEAEPKLADQARDGAVWAARRLRDDFLVTVMFGTLVGGGLDLDPEELRVRLDQQLTWTSAAQLGFELEPDDERLQRPFDDYAIPLTITPDAPKPFWVGAAWGLVRWHGLATLALRAREHGEDILAEWEKFQLQ